MYTVEQYLKAIQACYDRVVAERGEPHSREAALEQLTQCVMMLALNIAVADCSCEHPDCITSTLAEVLTEQGFKLAYAKPKQAAPVIRLVTN